MSQFSFAKVPSVEIPRSSFNRSFNHKTCINTDYLYPVYCQEVIPGDTFNTNLTAFGRLNTLIRPIMDNLYLDFFFFYVPNRLVWSHWVNMLGQRDNPSDSIDYSCPMVESGADGFDFGSIYDYLGLPVKVPNLEVSALPLRAINLIYNDHFRDENLCDQLPVNRGDEYDNKSIYNLFKRGKRHDYFTSCLTSPQKGIASSINIGGAAPVYGVEDSGDSPFSMALTDGSVVRVLKSGSSTSSNTAGFGSYADVGHASNSSPFPSANVALGLVTKSQVHAGLVSSNDSGLYADLSDASAVTVNQLREAIAIQRLLERDSRGGTRINELIFSHFGVEVPDYRVQRSEYLGGGSVPVSVHSIAQTSSTNDTSPQGNLTANGTVAGSVGFSKSFVEHGFVIGFVNLRADLNYQQGLHRMWSRKTRYDWYWPALSHLGEQVVYNREIYAQGNYKDDLAFGYQERWAEYRYSVNQVTSVLRSQHPQSLDSWHLAQDFTSLPTLSKEFIEESVPIDRALAVASSSDSPALLLDMWFKQSCVRPMPTYSVPGLMDHF
ncbi:major capsid protein [Capybara microvirus Cap1_SP_160]|nr:major capsid protein [Capybara microvirus Cap1_SP_160]